MPRLSLRAAGLALFALVVWIAPAAPTRAYVDLAPTLAKVIKDAQKISLVEVTRFDREHGTVVLKEVRPLKGEAGAETVKHRVASTQGTTVPRPILEWAEPGARAVLFTSGTTSMVCTGHGWYQVHAAGNGWWTLGADRPDLPLAYYGTVSRLADAIGPILAGKDAVITTIPHGVDNEGASFDLALNRASLPGLMKVQRIRANLAMPAVVMAASPNPAYMVGSGFAGEEEIPALAEKLKSADADAAARGEAADELRSLGAKAAPASTALTALLNDPAPRARLSAAAALLRIDPKNVRPVEVLAAGLDSADSAERRRAAQAAGLAGPPAAALTARLAVLLKDPDELTRRAALQAVATLGPAAAGAAESALPLLDDPATQIDAADALGRIGPAARAALPRLAKMLTAEPAATRWAGVRAMSQIGGDDAAPAAAFMARELRAGPSEADGYNMMIYLALLGPAAKEAVPAIQSVRIKNPVLPTATLWAIDPDKNFPWLAPQRGPGGGGGPGGPPGGLQGADFARYIYEAYVHELGDRLRPAATALAGKILDGTAGDVPGWGYKILSRAPDQTVPLLAPHLGDADLVRRERAAVALGFMGADAAPAKAQVADALRRAATERESRLMKWCLRQVSKE